MKVATLFLSTIILLLSHYAHSSLEDVPKVFRDHDDNSKLTLGYDDLDAFLKAHVLVVGPSTRERAPKAKTSVGTKLKTKINRDTFLEGNRFHFESLRAPETQALLQEMQESLESLPTEVPLALLSKNDQLAYWLNLYNFTLLNELAQAYPKKRLNRLLDYGDDDSILAQKILTVAGESLSLDDIHFNILKNKFDANPLIIYGLFQGNIGGPNIRNQAFDSENVWKSLERNAINYINSNRATNFGSKNSIKASLFYEHNMPYFNNNKQRLLAHIENYAIDELSERIASATDVRFSIKDWSYADVFGNNRQFGGSYHTSAAALLNAVQTTQRGGDGGGSIVVPNDLSTGFVSKAKINLRFTQLEVKLLKELRRNYDIDMGRVTVEDIDDDEEKP